MTSQRGFIQFGSTQTQLRLIRERSGRMGAPLRPLDARAVREWHPAHGRNRLLYEDAEQSVRLYEQRERRVRAGAPPGDRPH